MRMVNAGAPSASVAATLATFPRAVRNRDNRVYFLRMRCPSVTGRNLQARRLLLHGYILFLMLLGEWMFRDNNAEW